MLCTTKRLSVGLATALGSVAIPVQVLAGVAITPFGPADESCVHEVPAGGSVDVGAMNVMLNGALVAHYDPCTITVTVPVQNPNYVSSNGVAPTGGGGWYEGAEGNATTISGLTQFDSLSVDWVVPAKPNLPANDPNIVYLFPGLENVSNSWVAIIQPVLQWGNSNVSGYQSGEYWTIGSWMVENTGSGPQVFFHTGSETVQPGDYIEGAMTQYAANLDAWNIKVTDEDSGAWASLDVYNLPSSWPKFNFAQMGILEGYGSNLGPLSSCVDLSPSNSVSFFMNAVQEAGPSWNSFNNAQSLVQWFWFKNTGLSPQCQYDPFVDEYETVLNWVN